MSGWIKMHRQIMDSDLWSDVTTFRLFMFLLMMAAHQDGVKVHGHELKRGQYIRSYRNLAKDLAYKEGRGTKTYSLSTIKKSINKLVEAERVNVKETELGTLFTILNYAKYQGFEEQNNITTNTKNEEVRTNRELKANEVRTNCEQEQELKNLRIKELSTTTTTPTDLFVEVHRAFESSICRLSAFQVESLEHWFNDFGQDKDILLEAIRIADDKNKRHYAFVEYLLKEWSNNRLTTVEQIRSHERNKFSNVRPFEPKKKVDSEYNYGF